MKDQDGQAPESEMFQQYQRKQIAELRPYVAGDDMTKIAVSSDDAKAGSPKAGDMIARNPKNHKDQWLVAAAYFADNFEPIGTMEGEWAPRPAEHAGDEEQDPVADWIDAVEGAFGDYAPPPAPLEELAGWLREEGELGEIPALALLDEIAGLRRQVDELEAVKNGLADAVRTIGRAFMIGGAPPDRVVEVALAAERTFALVRKHLGCRDGVSIVDHAKIVRRQIDAFREFASKIGIDINTVPVNELPGAVAAVAAVTAMKEMRR